MFGFVSPWTKLRLKREAKKAEALRLEELERQERVARANKLRADLENKERQYYSDRLEKISFLSAVREQQAALQREGMPSRHLYQDPPRIWDNDSDSISMLAAQQVIESASNSSASCSSFSFSDSSSSSSSSSDCGSSDSGSSSGGGD